MAKLEVIARQSAHPRGLLGHVVARVMSIDTARANGAVLEALDPRPGERVLELGCGHGRALARVAAAVAPGLAAGVDPSEVMLRVARRRLRGPVRAGHARIDAGESGQIPHPDGDFDAAFSVHTLYFWPDLSLGLAEIRRVLRDGGRLVLGFHSSDDPALARRLPASVYTLRSREQVAERARRAGFADVTVSVDPATGLSLARARARA
jgi:ubiquinone/menaquinone biosynthesis C-methylase UbiE